MSRIEYQKKKKKTLPCFVLFLKTVFENIKNIILVLSKNRGFYVLHVFQNIKTWEPNIFLGPISLQLLKTAFCYEKQKE